MPADSKSCEMCLPSLLNLDISRPMDLTMNSAEDIFCPSYFVNSDVQIDCVLKDFINREMDEIRAPGCKLPANMFQNKQLYEMTVTFAIANETQKVSQKIKVMTSTPDASKTPSCTLEGFNDLIELEADGMHSVRVGSFKEQPGQTFRWECKPRGDAKSQSETMKCPFESLPRRGTTRLTLFGAQFAPDGARFDLTLTLVNHGTNVVESCGVTVLKKFNRQNQQVLNLQAKSVGSLEMLDPESTNEFTCEHEESSVNTSELTYDWEIVDVVSGAKLLTEVDQVSNRMTVEKN